MPQQLFKDLNIPGIDINSAECGWMLQGADHIGKHGIHEADWNEDWIEWLAEMKKNKIEITKELVDERLREMIEKYDLNGRGFKARFGYSMKQLAYLAAYRAWKRGVPLGSILVKQLQEIQSMAMNEASDATKVKPKPKGRMGKVGGGIAGGLLGMIPSILMGSSDPMGELLDGMLLTSPMGHSRELPYIDSEFRLWDRYQQNLDFDWEQRLEKCK